MTHSFMAKSLGTGITSVITVTVVDQCQQGAWTFLDSSSVGGKRTHLPPGVSHNSASFLNPNQSSLTTDPRSLPTLPLKLPPHFPLLTSHAPLLPPFFSASRRACTRTSW